MISKTFLSLYERLLWPIYALGVIILEFQQVTLLVYVVNNFTLFYLPY